MKDWEGVRVRSATAIAAPANFALAAVDTVLREFSRYPGATSLALDIEQLHVPFRGVISVPVHAIVGPGESRNQWHLNIRAATNPGLYPTFEGVITLLSAASEGSELDLDGTYALPLGFLGELCDSTVFHGAAQSSLQRFLRDVASRAAALSKWAQAYA